MPFVPVLQTVEVDLQYLYRQQFCSNTMYFTSQVGDPTPSGVLALATAVEAWATANLLPILSQDCQLFRLHARELTAEVSSVADVSSGTVGGIATTADPNNVTLAVSFRTGVIGRSFRGRNYIIGIPQGVISDNTVAPSFLADVLTAFAALPAAVTTDWLHSVVSRFTAGLPRVAGVSTPVTTVAFTDNIVDSQRRRLPGRGR